MTIFSRFIQTGFSLIKNERNITNIKKKKTKRNGSGGNARYVATEEAD